METTESFTAARPAPGRGGGRLSRCAERPGVASAVFGKLILPFKSSSLRKANSAEALLIDLGHEGGEFRLSSAEGAAFQARLARKAL